VVKWVCAFVVVRDARIFQEVRKGVCKVVMTGGKRGRTAETAVTLENCLKERKPVVVVYRG